jgi:2,3-bisphosphoglycerate-independent phosphoglycerate mutase
MTKPVLLCILDGWGESHSSDSNAIAMADTPNWDAMLAQCPHSRLETSGLAVGLPEGQMGNSEVGHMNLGGGRVVLQDLPRIDQAIKSGAIAHNTELTGLIARAKAAGGALHILGLLSPGGVHAHQDHMAALARLAADAGVRVVVHAFLDGRDTPPRSAEGYVERFEAAIASHDGIRIGTISGRYYAMDRDKRWDRVSKAYDAMVSAKGEAAGSALAAIRQSYAADRSDEFVLPTVIGDYAGMADGDALLMANFRADRAREILTALVDPAFDGFARATTVRFSAQAGMVEYSTDLARFLPALFPPEDLRNTLGEVVSRAGLRQLRAAETEKYAHVTFFFNGGEERVFAGEDRILIPSPKVATYDLQPEMSAPELTDRLVEAVGSGTYDLIICNFANPDMVGHTGIIPAAIKAAETVDESLGRLRAAIETAGGDMLVTADHGNLEFMADPETGQAHTAHTLNPVPLVLIGRDAASVRGLKNGRLADVAPTILDLLEMPRPEEMTGRSLLERATASGGLTDRLRA